jgi:glutamate dehydrogenase (NAD(P)+)
VCTPDLLCNGGGVTCSYFEWLKNLEHISPGKMTKKYEEKSQMRLLEIMGYDIKNANIKGASEIDIVYSGLEEIMCSAVKENWELSIKKNLSFRDACLVNAITKVYLSYKENGIMI